MEIVGKSITEVGAMLLSVGCVTKDCPDAIIIHAGEIETSFEARIASHPMDYEVDALRDHRIFPANIVNRGRMKQEGGDK